MTDSSEIPSQSPPGVSRSRQREPKRSGPWAAAGGALFASILVAIALSAIDEPLSPQSLANVHFAETDSYAIALDEYSRVWPPLYPTVLWAFARAGVAPQHVNLVLFLSTLALLYPISRRLAPAVNPALPVGLYALSAWNYANLHQVTSEALLIPLALLAFAFTTRAVDEPTRRNEVLLGVTIAAALATRYFAIVWLLPMAAAALACSPRPPRSARIREAVGLLVAAATPVASWMLHARQTTGYFTGAPRFAPRGFEEKTTLAANLLHGARSLLLDFVGRSGGATHAAVGRDWALSGSELLAAVVLIGLLLACLAVTARLLLARRIAMGARAALLAWLSFGHLALVVILWTVGNNDPIYSRFLYPAYPFLLLACLRAYASLAAVGGWLDRAPFQALYAFQVMLQGSRTFGDTLASFGLAT